MNPSNRKNGAPVPRVHVGDHLAPGARVILPEATGHHLTRVLRLRPGAAVVLFDGCGGEYAAKVRDISKQGVAVDVGPWHGLEREAALELHLAQGVSSGERMDYTLQKAVELGIRGIEPVVTERSVVQLDAERAARRRGHWERVCVSACEQCGRNRVPPVQAPITFDAWLDALSSGDSRFALRVLLAPDGAHSLRDLPRPEGPILLLAGPEGGLTPGERSDALGHGFCAVRLGPRVLRTETAALAALAAMHALWGDF
jgi:16S rRNA (uracil1498-N3)-methyltransferase